MPFDAGIVSSLPFPDSILLQGFKSLPTIFACFPQVAQGSVAAYREVLAMLYFVNRVSWRPTPYRLRRSPHHDTGSWPRHCDVAISFQGQ